MSFSLLTPRTTTTEAEEEVSENTVNTVTIEKGDTLNTILKRENISNEDIQSALRILELRAKVFDLNLKQKDLGYYGQTNELRALDHKLYMLYKSITK
jgi:hypothetical protein